MPDTDIRGLTSYHLLSSPFLGAAARAIFVAGGAVEAIVSTPVRTRALELHPITVSAQRREAVDKARQSWIRKLIDLSRRNNLLYYRPLKTEVTQWKLTVMPRARKYSSSVLRQLQSR